MLSKPGALDYFCGLARNNAWSNHRLYKACSLLSDTERKAARTSFFPTIHLTLNHILAVDLYYTDALIGEPVDFERLNRDELYEDFGALRAAQSEEDRRLIDFVEGLRERALAREVSIERRDGNSYKETVATTILHLSTHQIHHRGQIHAMLAGTAVKPPQLDEYFLKQDARFRGEDLRALGWPSE
ncbi:MAG: DinB family protein [Kiloniellales bacterium]